MRKRTSSGCYSSGKFENLEMGTNIDLSLLRRPLTPFTGFQEAKNAFDKGTVEVRHLLLYECGLIYECNVCRNMFRSLANFISHKRVFCCTSSREYNGTYNSTNGTDGTNSTKQQSREYLLSKHEAELRQKIIVESKEAATSRQTYSENNTGIEPTDKQVPTGSTERTNQKHKPTKLTDTESDVNAAKPSEQSLNQSKEFPTSAYVFQCPSCSLTFLKSSSVIRHLAVAHNIPIRRIRMMRDSILKCRAEPATENAEKPTTVKHNRELKGLQLSDSSSSGGEEKRDTDNKQTSKCFFCQKSFERRAAMSTHMQNCPIKAAVVENQVQATVTSNGKRIKLETNTLAIPKEAAIAADIDCQLVENKQENNESGTHNTSLENEDVKRIFVNLENQSFGTGLQTVSLDKLDISAGESTNASLVAENELKEVERINEMDVSIETVEKTTATSTDISSTATNNTTLLSIKKRRMRITNAQSCRCKICSKQFNALSNLRRHISMFHYRARKFGCALCDYCAFRRYDIINHLNFVHKLDTDNDTTSKDLVRVNDVQYTKDDMNDDIVLCSSDDRDAAAETIPNSTTVEEKSPSEPPTEHTEAVKIEKRQRRRRYNKSSSALTETIVREKDPLPAADNKTTEVKLTRQKFKRSQSQISEAIYSMKSTQKRPKRNRTKPVNKDFVYDLSALSKKEAPQAGNISNECDTYQLRGLKRRNTLHPAHLFENTPSVPAFELIKVKHSDAIRGAARRSCLLLVNQGFAASSTLPEIPAERPQMRPRLTSLQRSDSQAGPIIETTELEAARLKSLPLCDDSYLEKITKESVGHFKIKPCLAQQHSALDSLLQKVDSSKQLNGVARNASNQICFQPSLGIKDDNTSFAFLSSSLLEAGSNNNIKLSTLPPYLVTPEQAIPKTLSTPTKPQKRLPSLDRLTETINSENFYNAQLKN